LFARHALQRAAPGAGLQPLRLVRVSDRRVLCLAARGRTRPPDDAIGRDDPGHEDALPAARRRRARGADRALAAYDSLEALRAQHLLRLQPRGAARGPEPRDLQSVPGAADARVVLEILDDWQVAALEHHADSGRRPTREPRGLRPPGDREPLRAPRARRPLGPQREVRARPRDPRERRRTFAAVESRGLETFRE